jgi:hypothetical protein
MNFLSIKWWGPLYTVAVPAILYSMWTVRELRPENLALLWLSSVIVIVVIFFNYHLIKSEIRAREQMVARLREIGGQPPLPPERGIIESIIAKIKKK